MLKRTVANSLWYQFNVVVMVNRLYTVYVYYNEPVWISKIDENSIWLYDAGLLTKMMTSVSCTHVRGWSDAADVSANPSNNMPCCLFSERIKDVTDFG